MKLANKVALLRAAGMTGCSEHCFGLTAFAESLTDEQARMLLSVAMHQNSASQTALLKISTDPEGGDDSESELPDGDDVLAAIIGSMMFGDHEDPIISMLFGGRPGRGSPFGGGFGSSPFGFGHEGSPFGRRRPRRETAD